MALDKVRLLVNKIRRLRDSNENGENDFKIDALYEELCKEIENSNIKVRLVAKIDKTVYLNETDNWEEWLVDNLVESEDNPSTIEVFAKDICQNGYDGFSYYIDLNEDVEAHVYDENGKEICSNKE